MIRALSVSSVDEWTCQSTKRIRSNSWSGQKPKLTYRKLGMYGGARATATTVQCPELLSLRRSKRKGEQEGQAGGKGQSEGQQHLRTLRDQENILEASQGPKGSGRKRPDYGGDERKSLGQWRCWKERRESVEDEEEKEKEARVP